jgi:opacity protein-like surface antigen
MFSQKTKIASTRKESYMNKQITSALAVAIALAAGTADAQTRVNPDRSADQLNARVLEVLQARETAAHAPVAATPAPTPTATTLTGVYLGVNVGSNWRDNTDYSLGAVAGYQFHRNLAAEVTYDNVQLGNANGFNDGQMVMANLVAGQQIGATGITPYVLAGAGIGWNQLGDRTTGDNLALYNVGAGVRLNLVSNVDLDARYRYVGAFDDNANGNSHMVTAGLNIRF